MQQLIRALPAYTALKFLNLSGHRITGESLELLAGVLLQMPCLEDLKLAHPDILGEFRDRSTFDGKALVQLHQQIKACPSLKRLILPKRLKNTAEARALDVDAKARTLSVTWH